MSNYCKECFERQEKINRLEQENKELKSMLDFEVQKREEFADKNTKYEFVLEEIKNLAELEVMLDKNSKAFYPANIQRILDVINEVLNDRN